MEVEEEARRQFELENEIRPMEEDVGTLFTRDGYTEFIREKPWLKEYGLLFHFSLFRVGWHVGHMLDSCSPSSRAIHTIFNRFWFSTHL
jgi:hypothetical protein